MMNTRSIYLSLMLLIFCTITSFAQNIQLGVQEQIGGDVDTFYFQKQQATNLGISFSNSITSFFIGKNAGTSNIGNNNIGLGNYSLQHSGNAHSNIAIGRESLKSLNTGTDNIAIGSFSMTLTTTAHSNTAIGKETLHENSTGVSNTAVGFLSLSQNTVGNENVGIGAFALSRNQFGTNNVALGYEALKGVNGNSHYFNTAIGSKAMQNNSTGFANVAVGTHAFQYNSTGTDNVVVGFQALNKSTSTANVVIGSHSLSNHTSGNGNVALGYNAGTNNISGTGNIFIGYSAGADESGSNKLYIDNSNTSSPLIYGDFSSKLLRVNGSLLEIAHSSSPILRFNRAGASYDYDIYMDGPNLKFRGGGPSGNTSLFKDRVTFDAYGRVGINVPSPTHKLDVEGDVNIRSENSSGSLFTLEKSNGTTILNVETGSEPVANFKGFLDIDSPIIGSSYPDNNKAIQVNGSFLMNSLGQIKMGPASLSSPVTDLHIKQSFDPESGVTTHHPGIRLEYNTSNNHWDTYIDSYDDYCWNYNGVLKGYIKDTDGVYVTTSDRRLKNTIAYMGNSLKKLNQLKPATYRYNSDPTGTTSYGLIAQELQAVFPDMVIEKNGELGVAYNYLIPVTIKAVQELSEENESLRSEIDILKKEIEEIKQLLKQ